MDREQLFDNEILQIVKGMGGGSKNYVIKGFADPHKFASSLMEIIKEINSSGEEKSVIWKPLGGAKEFPYRAGAGTVEVPSFMMDEVSAFVIRVSDNVAPLGKEEIWRKHTFHVLRYISKAPKLTGDFRTASNIQLMDVFINSDQSAGILDTLLKSGQLNNLCNAIRAGKPLVHRRDKRYASTAKKTAALTIFLDKTGSEDHVWACSWTGGSVISTGSIEKHPSKAIRRHPRFNPEEPGWALIKTVIGTEVGYRLVIV